MKIAIFNDLYKYGGSEVQIFREQKILIENGCDAVVLTFDDTICTGYIEKKHFNICTNRSVMAKAINRFIINYRIYSIIKKFLKTEKPDIIHFNNINYSPFTVILACKSFRCFQTIRDYSAICPKGTCIKSDLNICKGYNISNCSDCIEKNIYLKVRMLHLSLFNNYRKKNIIKFICPSKELTDYCNNNGLDTVCINNPFDANFEKKGEVKKIINQKKVFLYYGQLKIEKGIDRFIEAFHQAKLSNAKLLLCGKIEKNLLEYMDQLSYVNVEYLGVKEYEDMLELVSNVDFVVVPSLWIENYPNTVLEGMALSKVVISSNRGGMISMINDENLIFDVLNIEDMIKKIQYCYNMDLDTYKMIVNRNKKYILNHNLENIFFSKIMKVFNI